jgi:hypothetical protein
MLSKSAVIVYLILGVSLLALGHPHAESKSIVLITAEEAQRPPPPSADLTFRAGISRGPGIELVSPKASEQTVHSPVHLQLKFEGRGGAQINVDSLKFTYIRNPSVDLTGRIKSFVRPDGIDVPEAEMPPGTHIIRADVKDKEGRSGSLIFRLNVVN